jgi:hypothetical protein
MTTDGTGTGMKVTLFMNRFNKGSKPFRLVLETPKVKYREIKIKHVKKLPLCMQYSSTGHGRHRI